LSIDFSLIIPELLILSSFLFVLLLLVFSSVTKLRWLSYSCILVVIAAMALTFVFKDRMGIVSDNFLEVSKISNFFRYLFLFSGAGLLISLIVSKVEKPGIYALILISIFGAMSLGLSSNLLSLLMFLEIVTVSSYFIPTLKFEKIDWLSYLRYVIFGIISTFLFIYLFSFIYGISGSLSLNVNFTNIDINKVNILLIIVHIVIMVIMSIRLSLFPFHILFPSLAKDSGFFTTLFFSILVIPANLLVFKEIFEKYNFLDFKFTIYIILLFLCLTILFFNIAAIYQKNIWKFLAFSNVVQICFIIIDYYLFPPLEELSGITPYLPIYLISTSALIIGLETYRKYKLKTNWVDFLEDIKGAIRTAPVLTFSLSVILISLIGIPGTAGFLIKQSFISFINVGIKFEGITGFAISISIFLIINYLIIFYYYGRIILSMWSKPKTDIYLKSKKVKLNLFEESSPYLLSLAFIILCSIIILALGIYGIINPTLSKILFPLFK